MMDCDGDTAARIIDAVQTVLLALIAGWQAERRSELRRERRKRHCSAIGDKAPPTERE